MLTGRTHRPSPPSHLTVPPSQPPSPTRLHSPALQSNSMIPGSGANAGWVFMDFFIFIGLAVGAANFQTVYGKFSDPTKAQLKAKASKAMV